MINIEHLNKGYNKCIESIFKHNEFAETIIMLELMSGSKISRITTSGYHSDAWHLDLIYNYMIEND